MTWVKQVGECYDECIFSEKKKLWSVLPALFWVSNVTSNLQPLTTFYLGYLPKTLKDDHLFGQVGVKCAERHLLINYVSTSVRTRECKDIHRAEKDTQKLTDSLWIKSRSHRLYRKLFLDCVPAPLLHFPFPFSVYLTSYLISDHYLMHLIQSREKE